jgi:hypothetical protein
MMSDTECDTHLKRLRKKKPTIWVAIIANGRTDVIARRLMMSPKEILELKANTKPIDRKLFDELRAYAIRRRQEINRELRLMGNTHR